MAIYHLHTKHLGRSNGDAACKDYYYGKVHDYTNKGGVVYETILLPPEAPIEFNNREIL